MIVETALATRRAETPGERTGTHAGRWTAHVPRYGRQSLGERPHGPDMATTSNETYSCVA